MKIKIGFVVLAGSLSLASCSNIPLKPSDSDGFYGTPLKPSDSGGFYGGDNAPTDKRDFESIADAIPKYEPLSRTGNKPYIALGKHFKPLKSSKGYVKKGVASWYGTKFHGRRTSSGETYDMWAMTAAHPILPLPTYVEVTNLDTGKKIIVKVNDRGPFLHGRIIDLSYVAAHKLGIAKRGTGNVMVKAIDLRNDAAINSPGISGLAGEIGNVAPSATDTSGQAQSDARYFIQVGAYSEISNAESMRNRLHQQGHLVYPQISEQKQPYRVQVGPFLTIESALQVKHKIEQLLNQALILIRK